MCILGVNEQFVVVDNRNFEVLFESREINHLTNGSFSASFDVQARVLKSIYIKKVFVQAAGLHENFLI